MRTVIWYPLLLSLFVLACSQSNDPLQFDTSDSSQSRNQSCIDGEASGYPCLNVDLRARLSPGELFGERLNDIWGWTDPQTGREYALVGMTDGVSFVDISSPADPVVIGILPESLQGGSGKWRPGSGVHLQDDGEEKSTWRDLKVYNDHLFVVSDGQPHGLQIFDLTRLRTVTQVPATFSSDANYRDFESAHNIAINEETGFAYVVGSEVDGGGLYILDISSPKQPEFVTTFADTLVGHQSTGYVHDTQCVVYRGPDSDYTGRELCFNASETHLAVVDVTEKQAIETISRNGYQGNRYAHQGWLTEDHRYFLLDDELDENQNGHNTRTYIWDMEDLDSPQMIGIYEAPYASIDHNQYVLGNNLYQTNYTAGLRILNLDGIGSGTLEEVAFFDTYAADDNPKFEGAWSSYPFFESGIVVVSDVTFGLFILQPAIQ